MNSSEIEEEGTSLNEVQCCDHCDMDGLGNCCIGEFDPECTKEEPSDDDP